MGRLVFAGLVLLALAQEAEAGSKDPLPGPSEVVWIPGPFVGLPLRIGEAPRVLQLSGGQSDRDEGIDESGGCDVAGPGQHRRLVLVEAIVIVGGGLILLRLLGRRRRSVPKKATRRS